MPRVLCIESDAALRSTMRQLLESSGFTVEDTASGLEGITRALTYPPDLVLADDELPDIEGHELATCLKQEASLARVPFVLVSKTGQPHEIALAAGCDGFIEKPFNADAFAGEVRAFLEGKREILAAEGERASLKTYSAELAHRLEHSISDFIHASDQLREADRLKCRFMQNLSHEISTPLTPLAGYLRILRSEKLGVLSEQQKKILDGCLSGASRLARIIANLAEFANLEAGLAPAMPAPLDPDAMADEIVAELRTAAKDRRVHITLEPGGVGLVLADPRKLKQAVTNLLSNAIKFSPPGSEVMLQVVRAGELLRFCVYDQGPGIAKADLGSIFEPFFHAARNDAAGVPGSGLGLPVARRIAEGHGGRVYVESPPLSQPGSGNRHYNGAKFVLEIHYRKAT